MLGLHRDEVRLVPYEPRWAHAFAEEKTILLAHGQFYIHRIEHVGSTAVPGLIAKPILDIAVIVHPEINMEALSRRFVHIGYIDRGDRKREGGHLFVKEAALDVRTHHVHVINVLDKQWRDYVAFRDRLRTDENVRRRYAALKRNLYQQHEKERQRYTRGKAEFIQYVLSLSRKG